MRFSLALGISIVSAAGLAACGDDGGKATPDSHITVPDANHGTDGSNSGSDGSGSGSCTLAATTGSVDGSNAQLGYSASDGTTVDFLEDADFLNLDAAPDLLAIQLYAGYPDTLWANGFPATPATVDLSMTLETTFDTCSACLLAYTDATVDQTSGQITGITDTYMANSGTLTLTSLTSSSFAGSFTNVRFRHVEIDQTSNATTDDADGCTGTVASYSFSGTPTNEGSGSDAGAFEGRGGRGKHLTLHITNLHRIQ